MNDSVVFNHKLKQALEIYQQMQLSVLPTKKELENIYTFSSSFEIKMNRLIRIQSRPYYKIINSVGKRVAIIVVTLFITLMTTVLSVESLRNNVFDFFIEIYEKFSVIFLDKNIPDDSEITIIEKVYVPEHLPDGFVLTSRIDMDTVIRYVYSDNKGNQLLFEQSILLSEILIDTEHRKSEEIDLNGIIGLYYIDKEYSNIIWNYERYGFHLISKIDKEEMIKVAKSVIPQNK